MVGPHLVGILGQLLVGDAVTIMLAPKRHFLLWHDLLPESTWRDMVRAASEQPGMARVAAVVEAAIGILLILEAVRKVKR